MKKLLLVLILSLGLIGISSAEEVDTNILKLKSLNACKGCSFIGIDFGGSDFWGANLSGANLSGTRLNYANLRDADLSGADLSGSTLCNTETPWGIDDSGC